MTASVMLAVLVAAMLHAGWNTLVKGGRDKLVATVLVCLGAGVLPLPLLLVLPAPAWASLPYVVASAVIHVGYFTLVGLAYRTADLSIAYPLTRGLAPVLTTAVAAVALGEWPNAGGVIGVVAMSAGILWLAADGLRSGGLDRRSGLIALANALIITAYTIVDGQGGRLSGHSLSYNCAIQALSAALFVPLAGLVRGRALLADLRAGWWLGLIGGALVFSSYGIAIWAMTAAPIGLVAALRETSVLFGAGFAALFLGERFGPARYAAVVLVVAGLIGLRYA